MFWDKSSYCGSPRFPVSCHPFCFPVVLVCLLYYCPPFGRLISSVRLSISFHSSFHSIHQRAFSLSKPISFPRSNYFQCLSLLTNLFQHLLIPYSVRPVYPFHFSPHTYLKSIQSSLILFSQCPLIVHDSVPYSTIPIQHRSPVSSSQIYPSLFT